MPPPDTVEAILADWRTAAPEQRYIARPTVIERLRAAGVDDPERLLGDDTTADGEEPTIDEIVAAVRALPDGATVADVEPLLRGVAAALSNASPFERSLASAKMHEVLRDRGIPGAAALARTACSPAACAMRIEEVSGGQGQPLVLDDPEPSDDPIDGAALLDDLEALVRCYVVLSVAAARAVALWIVHTYAIAAADISARLVVTSPQRRCGKSTLLDLLSALALRALSTSNISPAAMFRVVEACSPTLLVDEADTFLDASDELRGIVNAGHARGGGVIRTVGDDYEPRRFGVFGALAIAAIGHVPATIADRAVEIRLARKMRGEHVARLCRATIGVELEPQRRRLARWTADHVDMLRAADPAVPIELHDRQADGWRPLLAIADAAGGQWPSRARDAARALAGAVDSDEDDIGTLLLADLRDIFGAADRLPSEVIVGRLGAMAERPWPEYGRNRRPITQAGLARALNAFGVRPRGIRIGADTPRGYVRADLEPAWARYLSPGRRGEDEADPDSDDPTARDEVAA